MNNVYLMPLKFLFFLLGHCLFQNNANAQKVWIEKNKYVVFEIEDVDGGYTHTYWELFSEPKGWTGSGYLVWKGTPIQGSDTETMKYDDMEDSRKLSYLVKINNPGVYYLKVRNYHVGKGSGEHVFDGDNDCFISINKGHYGKQYDHDTSAFTWDETGMWRKAKLNVGVYEISIGGRSRDFGADRIALFHEDQASDNFGDLPRDWLNEYEWSSAPASEFMVDQKKP